MKTLALNILVVPGLLGVASTASAQTPSNTAAPATSVATLELEEVIVTARRKFESVQDVPTVVNAVSGEVIEKLNILKFEEVAAVVPGLTLGTGLGNPGTPGTGTSISMRGVSFSPDAQTSSNVEYYLNDALVESNQIFQSMFDIGQIEVLRGPQGTLRGRSAPSGAITITTRKPQLSELGGYVSGTATDLNATNLQAAINVPLVKDILAVRVAALDDRNEGDGVKSVHSSVDPSNDTQAARVSVRFEPTDTIAADLMYQHMKREQKVFLNHVGNGGPGGTAAGTTFAAPPAGYNGPMIGVGDRLSVTDAPFDFDYQFETLTANLKWAFAGQQLAYVGSYGESTYKFVSPTDIDNLIPNREFFQDRLTVFRQSTHELRLSSEERIAGFFDYTVGAFYSDTTTPTSVDAVASFRPGAFGSPAPGQNPSVAIYDPRYTIYQHQAVSGSQQESSVFANVTLHLGNRTELALGGRYISFKNDRNVTVSTTQALNAAFVGPAPCGVVPGAVGSTYPTTCDFVAPAGVRTLPSLPRDEKPFVYNASLSYHLTDDLLVYGNVGTAWRNGPYVVGINNAQADAALQALTDLPPEESISYELGFKSSFWDNRATINVALYHQDYDGLIFALPPTPYVSCTTLTACTVAPAQNFIASADSVVEGIDVDANFLLTPRWTMGVGASYADGHVDDDLIPCTPPGYDGTVASFGPDKVYLCNSNRSVSRLPPWTATLQTEYTMPITQSFEGYVRGLYTHYAENKNRSQNFVVSEYGLLNVYAGIRSPEGNWEISVFAKNALDEEQQLSLDPSVTLANAGSYFGSSGYQATSYTPRQEFGLSLRYAFGSR